MMRARSLMPLLLALGVSGCSLTPELGEPPVDVPTAWRIDIQTAAGAADIAWWERFDDPVLNSLIQEALANARDLRAAVARVDQAAGLLMQVRARSSPQLGYGLNVGRQLTGAADTNAKRNVGTTIQASLGVSWELDFFGRLRNSNAAAQSRLMASEEARRAVVVTLVANVANAYLQLRELDRQLEIAQATAKAQSESLRIFKLQFEAGILSLLQFNQAQSQYEEAAAAMPELERAIAQTENLLTVLLGRSPGTIHRGKELALLSLPPIPAGLPSSLLERRPDLKQAEQLLRAAHADVGVARAQYFPSISLTGLLGNLSAEAAKLFTGPARIWSFAGAVAGPILDGGAVAGQVQQAEGARDEALALYQQAVQSAFADANDALTAVQKTREQLAARQRQVAALRSYAELARLSYDAGNSPYLEVLNAEQSLFSNELRSIQAQGQALRAIVGVYAALGGGWVGVAEASSNEMAGQR